MQIREDKTHNITIAKVLAGYSTAEYLMVVTPHPDLWQAIMNIKLQFADNYKHPMASSTKPHLTLLKFYQTEINESRIVRKFDSVCAKQPAIKIELKDFGSFHSQTIFINVTSKVPILNLVKGLKEAHSFLKYDASFKPFYIADPHITIARQLLPWQYEKAWLEYSHASFTGRFIASKMTLLKRRVGNKAYQTVQEFSFQNLPPDAVQTSLFG